MYKVSMQSRKHWRAIANDWLPIMGSPLLHRGVIKNRNGVIIYRTLWYADPDIAKQMTMEHLRKLFR
jgi:hypothetical protein